MTNLDKMNINVVKNNNTVKFEYYSDGALWYSIRDSNNEYTFPIPIEEAKGGLFKRKDKALYFMRFIRKAVKNKTYRTEPFEPMFPADRKVSVIKVRHNLTDGTVVLDGDDWNDILETLSCVNEVYNLDEKPDKSVVPPEPDTVTHGWKPKEK